MYTAVSIYTTAFIYVLNVYELSLFMLSVYRLGWLHIYSSALQTESSGCDSVCEACRLSWEALISTIPAFQALGSWTFHTPALMFTERRVTKKNDPVRYAPSGGAQEMCRAFVESDGQQQWIKLSVLTIVKIRRWVEVTRGETFTSSE